VNSPKKINKEIEIEDLVKIYPESVTFLMEKGIRCLRCGEPIWGTLENAAKEKGFNENEIEGFINELNLLFNNKVN
jgi:methionine synthase II (cobalamin-independent)